MKLLNEGKNLDWQTVRGMLAEEGRTVLGREILGNWGPADYPEQVEDLLEETAQAETLLYHRGDSPIQPFEDVRPHLTRVNAGGVLSMRELLDIGQTLRCAEQVSRAFASAAEITPLLSAMAAGIDPYRRLEQEIERCIVGPEEMSDAASGELAQIRRRIRSGNAEIQQRLSAMIHSSSMKQYLQDAIVTKRNGRYVLPVRAEYRGQVQGIVHDTSGSGATLYIEPMAIVQINNELRTLMSQEQEEIERILAVLTAQVEGASQSIRNNLRIMGDLDVIFARAELARNMNATRPAISAQNSIVIRQGRHPLIPSDQVVPLDLWIGDTFTQLLITGPNTGGKTVTLKTVGLFAIMTQCGLFLPAAEGPQMPVFRQLFADIGDEQSIEQSLSTFSAHMTNIVAILNEVGPDTLVLLDELGAGTDPTEGAALAIAILEELKKKNVLSIATTHYSELKAYGMTTEGVTNASVEFDIETLRPTYRLSIGMPGRSNAFEISRRLGLPDQVIERAREHVSGENVRFEEVIASAQTQEKRAQAQIDETRQALEEARAARQEALKSRDFWIRQRDKLLELAREQAAQEIAQARREGQAILDEMNRKLRSGELKPHEMHALQKQFDEKMQEHAPQLESSKETAQEVDKLEVGMDVLYRRINQKATVLSPPDANGMVQIQVGIMKVTASRDELAKLKEPAQKKKAAPGKKELSATGRASVPLQLDIRGMNIEEARLEVDRYLDQAVLAGLTQVTIVHGKGTGALRTGVREYLKGHRAVKKIRSGTLAEGETGVSVVELK